MDKLPLTVPPDRAFGSFLFSDVTTDLDNLAADIVFMGIPYGSAYAPDSLSNDQTRAPDVIRQVSKQAVWALERYDFDVGGPIFDNRPIRTADVGNVPYDIEIPGGGHFAKAEEAMRKILRAGALPITFGGDHGIPNPIFRALSELHGEPITLVQIDAHIDWRDEVNGVRDGLSSPIRRASELPHIGNIFQIGIRAQGSGRSEEFEAAAAYGAHIIPAFEVHDRGIDAVLDQIPSKGRYYITIDADGLDPSVAPGVEGPAPGGLTFHQCRRLLHGLVSKGRVVGMDIVEVTPSRDINNITSIVAGRLAVNLIGAAVRAGYFDKA
ncbi:agmatinase [Aminobacter anthyllidis]|uniref:Agmatinase n=1 Tax=Aminobacter anthyllidis TaxID=1035067 RepID=A0A9X1AHQ3_9HYPH|nr:agmatinase [Aminobacter anthyllidis]MBT1159877.1 agmatinase [Aminobacter anthyllidis]